MKYVVFTSLWPSTIKILISDWPRTRKFSQRRPFLTTVTGWSRSTSNFYALIGQNLTGEFMRKIYAASWKSFSLTAKADRVLCQLVMFLTVFFHWMYKMKYSCYQESSVIHGWFVYWVFGWQIAKIAASKASPAVAWGGKGRRSLEIRLWSRPDDDRIVSHGAFFQKHSAISQSWQTPSWNEVVFSSVFFSFLFQ